MGAPIERAAETLAGAREVVVLTGAGISVESGIPDFRSVGGLWERFDPFDYASRGAFERDPVRCWELFRELAEVVGSAAPNPAHFALAQWEARLDRMTVITQNIDGLHQAAGSRAVLEFHGGSRELVCIACGVRAASMGQAGVWPPTCGCGQVLKPDVVLFGDPIPLGVWGASLTALERCQGVVVIGTSAQVAPFSELPLFAAEQGIPVVEINLESTTLTALPTLLLQGPAGEVVPALVDALAGRSVGARP